jgi:hypothetical protein
MTHLSKPRARKTLALEALFLQNELKNCKKFDDFNFQSAKNSVRWRSSGVEELAGRQRLAAERWGGHGHETRNSCV